MFVDNFRNYLGNGVVFEGNCIVVNFLKRVFIEVEIFFGLKGLKFCLIFEKIDVYYLWKDIKEYIRGIRFNEYFYFDKVVDGDFVEMLVFRKNLDGFLNGIEKYFWRCMWRCWRIGFCEMILRYYVSEIL